MRKVIFFSLLLSSVNAFTQTTYTFTGNGNWSDSLNWVNQLIPPDSIILNDSILIDPVPGGVCILDRPQSMFNGELIVVTGKKFQILDSLSLKGGAASEILTDAQIDLLDTLPDVYYGLMDIYVGGLPVYYYLLGIDNRNGGANRVKQKNDFIARMIREGDKLVIDAINIFPAGGLNEPAQIGLAYRAGGKDTARATATQGHCLIVRTHGLDCSGMIYQMTTKAGLPAVLPPGLFSVKNISNINKWNIAFQNSDDYDSLRMHNMGNISLYDMEVGDFIIWGDTHVGVHIGEGIYQSYGSFYFPKCLENEHWKRGPRILPLTQDWLNEFGQYIVYRIVIKPVISAHYDNTHWDYTTVKVKGKVENEAGTPVINRGFCWNTTIFPTIPNSLGDTSLGSGLGEFPLTLIGLTPGTAYYARAYAITASDTTYSEMISFETKDSVWYYFEMVGGTSWTVDYPANPAEQSKLVLDPFVYTTPIRGTGRYITRGGQPIPGGPVEITWGIGENNGKYYLNESGYWWHQANNSTDLTIPLSSFYTYTITDDGPVTHLVYTID